MSGRNPRDLSLWAIFRWPVVFCVLGLTGLVGALLTDGAWDGIFAALIATGVVAIVRARACVRR